MSVPEPSFTFGIEEEYHLVDLETRELAAAPQGLMEALESVLGRRVSPEFLRSQVEVGTAKGRDFAAARRDLVRLRATIGAEAARHGLAPIAASTHPFGRPRDLETTPKQRYRILARDLAGVGRRLVISGMHVHVGIEDDELRIDLMNQVRYFLPHLLMLSTSSPFWEGEDTGLKSYRLAVIDEMPRTGLPGRFESFDQYRKTIDVLVGAGVIEDATKVWWDLRPSARFPTLEMRITDVCPLVDDAVTIAALYVAITRMLYRLRRSNQCWRGYPLFLLAENRWRAQRYGVNGTLFDFGKGELVAFRDLIEKLLELVAPDAAALGCEREVARAREIARSGTSANRQVAEFERLLALGRTREEALRGVVDMLVRETTADLRSEPA
jgi:carboxylate-amine ligase